MSGLETEPIFPCLRYRVEEVNTHNTLSFHCKEFISILKNVEFYICVKCKIRESRNCENCYEFSKFPQCFLIYDEKCAFYIPLPTIFARRNTSYFKSFVTYLNKDEKNDKTIKFKYHRFTKECSFKGKVYKNCF